MILIIAEFIYQDSIIIDKSIFFMYIQSSKWKLEFTGAKQILEFVFIY